MTLYFPPKLADPQTSVVKHQPWRQILVVGFWLFTMANFGKDGGATASYSDMVAPHVGWYGGFLALCHGPPSAMDNTATNRKSDFMQEGCNKA